MGAVPGPLRAPWGMAPWDGGSWPDVRKPELRQRRERDRVRAARQGVAPPRPWAAWLRRPSCPAPRLPV